MILFYLELSHLKPEELHNFSQSLFVVLYFKFLERDGNRGPWPASIILTGLDILRLRRSTGGVPECLTQFCFSYTFILNNRKAYQC